MLSGVFMCIEFSSFSLYMEGGIHLFRKLNKLFYSLYQCTVFNWNYFALFFHKTSPSLLTWLCMTLEMHYKAYSHEAADAVSWQSLLSIGKLIRSILNWNLNKKRSFENFLLSLIGIGKSTVDFKLSFFIKIMVSITKK